MIKVTKLTTRPNTNVLWHFEAGIFDAGFYDHLQQTYKQTGKQISAANTFSEDGLQLTWTSFWNTQADYDEFQADPVLTTYWNLKQAYYDAHGVVMQDNVVEQA
jgi:hypothetical protein